MTYTIDGMNPIHRLPDDFIPENHCLSAVRPIIIEPHFPVNRENISANQEVDKNKEAFFRKS